MQVNKEVEECVYTKLFTSTRNRNERKDYFIDTDNTHSI